MLEFILKYWVDFVFGIIAAWLVAKVKHFQKLEQEKAEQEQAMLEKKITDTLEAKIKESEAISFAQDAQLKTDIANTNQTVEVLKQGLLSIQGAQFKRQCRILLKSSHHISTDEYEQCITDHDAYNALGGNHTGDQLFNSVVVKYDAQNSVSVQN